VQSLLAETETTANHQGQPGVPANPLSSQVLINALASDRNSPFTADPRNRSTTTSNVALPNLNAGSVISGKVTPTHDTATMSQTGPPQPGRILSGSGPLPVNGYGLDFEGTIDSPRTVSASHAPVLATGPSLDQTGAYTPAMEVNQEVTSATGGPGQPFAGSVSGHKQQALQLQLHDQQVNQLPQSHRDNSVSTQMQSQFNTPGLPKPFVLSLEKANASAYAKATRMQLRLPAAASTIHSELANRPSSQPTMTFSPRADQVSEPSPDPNLNDRAATISPALPHRGQASSRPNPHAYPTQLPRAPNGSSGWSSNQPSPSNGGQMMMPQEQWRPHHGQPPVQMQQKQTPYTGGQQHQDTAVLAPRPMHTPNSAYTPATTSSGSAHTSSTGQGTGG
jgi:hypothetical protein